MAEHPEPSELEGGRRLLTRKQALAGGGAAVAALGAPALAQAAGAKYPTVKVLELAKLKVNRAVPLRLSPGGAAERAARHGRGPCPRGVGPKRSIVAYSVLCQHMGCPVAYRRRSRGSSSARATRPATTPSGERLDHRGPGAQTAPPRPSSA